MAELFGAAYGEEAVLRNKDIQLAPGVNIHRSLLNGRNWEYCSEDPYLASRMAVPLEALQKKYGDKLKSRIIPHTFIRKKVGVFINLNLM